MKEVTLEYCNELMNKYNKYKETAEQHEFVKLMIMDSILLPAYNDLKRNYSQEHAEIFVRSIKNSVFPKLGITCDD